MDEPICLRKEKYMFYIVPENKEDLIEALGILSFYHVAAVSYIAEPDDLDTIYLAIIPDHYDHEEGDDDVGLAESAFQMNWHQGGKCPECTDEICGCMVFTKPIKPAF
jgi:hypothetical protein